MNEAHVKKAQQIAMQVIRNSIEAQGAAINILSDLAETDEQKFNVKDLRHSLRQLEVWLEETEAIYGVRT